MLHSIPFTSRFAVGGRACCVASLALSLRLYYCAWAGLYSSSILFYITQPGYHTRAYWIDKISFSRTHRIVIAPEMRYVNSRSNLRRRKNNNKINCFIWTEGRRAGERKCKSSFSLPIEMRNSLRRRWAYSLGGRVHRAFTYIHYAPIKMKMTLTFHDTQYVCEDPYTCLFTNTFSN